MDPLIHVGFPKCGSTWLQKKLFTNDESGFISPWGEIPALAIEHLLVLDAFRFDEEVDILREQYIDGFKIAEKAKKTPVLSYEHFLFDQMNNKNFIKENTYRIKQLFPKPKILLIIREQESLILSSYMEHLRRGFTTSLERFIGTEKHRRTGFGPVCNIDTFRYDKIISYLHNEFGVNSVLCLPLELIKSNKFTETITHFCNITHKGAHIQQTEKVRQKRKGDYFFLRSLNHIGHSRYNNFTTDTSLRKLSYYTNIALSRLVPNSIFESKKRKLKNIIHQHVGSTFIESNRNSSELIAIDLKKLGYNS